MRIECVNIMYVFIIFLILLNFRCIIKKREEREDFVGLAGGLAAGALIGTSKAKHKETRQLLKTMTEVTLNAHNKVMSQCDVGSTSINSADFTCTDNTYEVEYDKEIIYKYCMDNAKTTEEKENCSDGLYDCVFKDSEQIMDVKNAVKCTSTANFTTQVQEQIKEDLKQKLKNEEDGITNILKNMTGGGGSTTENDIDKTVRLAKTVNHEFINELSAVYYQENEIKVGGKSVMVRGISQSQKIDATAGMMANNSALLDVVSEIDTKIDQDLENKERGFAEMWANLMNMITSIGLGWFVMIAVVAIAAMFLGPSLLKTVYGTGGGNNNVKVNSTVQGNSGGNNNVQVKNGG